MATERKLKKIYQAETFTFPSTCRQIYYKMSTYLTQRPRSAMTQVRSFLTRMFLDLRSRWAMAGLPWVPEISRWRWVSPVAMESAMWIMRSGVTVFLK